MIQYPSYVQTAISRLEAAGFEAYVVGGALRDALLGASPYDWDVTTSATPDEMQAIFSDFSTVESGLKHGTLSVIIEHTPVEITTFRIDGGYTDARHPTSVTFTSNLREDLARRDFTVNALAYSRGTGLVDLFDGQKDLENKLVRAVGDPEKRFSEDALRILRAFRFASKLGFTIDENTLAGIKVCREGLLKISAERIAHELEGIIVGKHAYESLVEMKTCGVLSLVASPMTDGLSDLLNTLPQEFPIRTAYLLRHAEENEVSTLLSTLRLSNETTRHVKTLLALLPRVDATLDDYGVRRLMSRSGELFPELLRLAEVDGKEISSLRASSERFVSRGDCVRPCDLAVDGTALLPLGFSGKEMGTCLASLFDAVLRDPEKNTRNTLLALAAEKKKLDK